MSNRKRSYQNERKKRFDLNDENSFESAKNQNMIFGMLAKHKTAVFWILFSLLVLVIDIILTFLMVFGLI